MSKEVLTPQLFSTFKVSKVFKDHNRLINSIDWDDKGEFCLTCSDDESMRVYNALSGKLHNTVYSKKYGCAHARFTHRSNNLIHASTKEDDAIRYMSLHDNKYLRYFKGHTAKVNSLELSPINDTFMSASLDHTVRMWDLNVKDAVGIIETGNETNPLLAYDPSGLVFALGLGNNSIRMYNLGSPGSAPFLSQPVADPLAPPGSPPAEWTKMSFSNDGKYILICTRSNFLLLLDAFKATLVHR
ncbi:member of Set1p complex, histone methyl transferase [Kappamyces sp. JEL0680]|nr:member of Set1p complex, histone methyl transferase [Kappamyces sp. JEL0680]